MLNGSVAIVTGGSRGIGEAIVRKLVQYGANVAFTFVASAIKAEQLVSELSQEKNQVRAYQSDASSFAAAETLIQQVTADFGRIDILINNAGITRDNLLLRMTEEQFDEVIDNNLKSVFNYTRHVSKVMLKQRQGVILHIGSVVGSSGNPGQANYAAAKSALTGFTKSVAQELGVRNIRCNVVLPGFIETEMTDKITPEYRETLFRQIPLQRFGKAEEVAELVCFLASHKAAYITGQAFSVCGGILR